MKAENFAKLILKEFIHVESNRLSDFEYKLLECLCFQINRKVKYDLSDDGQQVIIMGTFYKYEDVTRFFDRLHIKYEIDKRLFINHTDRFHIRERAVERINPFLDTIRKYFEEQYGYVVEFCKYDGSLVKVSTPSELTEERLIAAIKLIAGVTTHLESSFQVQSRFPG